MLDHHELNRSEQKVFVENVRSLVTAFEQHGNPFLETTGDLLNISNGDIMDATVVKAVRTAKDIGKTQYHF